MSRELADALARTFAEFRPSLIESGLADFSRLRTAGSVCCRVTPRRMDTLTRIVHVARERDIPLRIRAQGHSLNGSSLPGAAELCVATGNIRHVRFEEPGTVTVGCGVVLWILQYMLRKYGFDIPVLNDGYPGPSVGGYIAAGGFGPRSAAFGGFWDNVAAVRVVDGLGQVLRITADDTRFPWLFGSMGQLGIVYDAQLAIVPLSASTNPTYPAGVALVAPQLADPRIPPEFATGEEERLFWFTLFTPDEHLDDAHRELSALEKRHRATLRFQERYRYPVLYRGRTAPLIYPYARAFTATGAWGWLTDNSPEGVLALHAFDREFTSLAASQPHLRRYVQSELPSGPEIYRLCFGEQTYRALQDLKLQMDPGSLMNRGSVFS